MAQIHDSGVIDAKENEIEDVVEGATKLLKRVPGWILYDVPLEVEWQIGRNWAEMEEV